MKRTIRIAMFCYLAGMLPSAFAAAQPAMSAGDSTHANVPLSVKAADAKWGPVFADLGERSPRITILRVDPVTHATQLMIQVPKNFHVPAHWHSANETHTVMKGTFIIECDGKRETLPAGSFNYVPAKMHHEAWTPKTQGATLFITVDGAWDINWVNGTPKAADMLGRGK